MHPDDSHKKIDIKKRSLEPTKSPKETNVSILRPAGIFNPTAAEFQPGTSTSQPINVGNSDETRDESFHFKRHSSSPEVSSSLTGRSPGTSKGVAANFLLNFQPFEPRAHRGGTPKRQPPNRKHHSSFHVPFDREKFLQANFRFVVAAKQQELGRYESDPDLAFEWENVIQVEVTSVAGHLELRCPITLETPFCPQITPCGHVFDFVGLMGHLVHHGGTALKKSAPCPLCGAMTAARDLRSAKIATVLPINDLADSVTLRLLRRGKNSILAEPVLGVAGKDPHSNDTRRYSKFTTLEDPMPLWSAEAGALAKHAACIIERGGPDAEVEVPLVYAALDAVAMRAQNWCDRRQRLLLSAGSDGISPQKAGELAAQAIKAAGTAALEALGNEREERQAKEALEKDFPALSIASLSKASTTADVVASPRDHVVVKQAGDDDRHFPVAPVSGGNYYYYYQAEDGQWVFLCPLNMRMLHMHYGSYEKLPAFLTAPVIELETETQTDVTRRRNKVLAHLPLTAAFRYCELDLSHVLPEAAIEPFAEDLNSRKKRRSLRAKHEAREMAKVARAAAALAAQNQGPSSAELKAMPALLREDTAESDLPHSSPPDENPSDAAPSFARIARLGFAATGPSLSEMSPSSSASASNSSSTIAPAATRQGPSAWGKVPSTSGNTSSVSLGKQADPSKPHGTSSNKRTLLFQSTSQRRY